MIKVNLQKFIGSIIIIIIIVVLIKITPFYNYSFDKIIQTKQQIIIYSQKSLNKSEGFITIEGKTKQQININNGLVYLPLNNQDGQKISFMAKQIYNNMYIFIQLTGNIIKIYPQSAIYTNKDLNIINIINGTISYLNLDKSKKILFKGKIIPLELDIKDNILNKIFQDQQNNNRKNIIGLYGGNIILNKTFDYIIYRLLILFSKISPLNYKDNLQNYYDFNNYINKDNSIQNQLIFKKNEKNYINRDIFKQFNKGLSKIFNSF